MVGMGSSEAVRTLLGLSFVICLYNDAENFGERDGVGASDASAIFVLRRHDGRLSFAPAAFAAHRAPRRVDRDRLALELRAFGAMAADAEGLRLTEEDCFNGRKVRVGGDGAQEDA